MESTLVRLPIALKRDVRARQIEAERKQRMAELFKCVSRLACGSGAARGDGC